MDDETPILELAEQARRYYGALREAGIPEVLATRMAGDWHQAVLTYVCNDMIARGRPFREAGQRFTQRVTRMMDGR